MRKSTLYNIHVYVLCNKVSTHLIEHRAYDNGQTTDCLLTITTSWLLGDATFLQTNYQLEGGTTNEPMPTPLLY